MTPLISGILEGIELLNKVGGSSGGTVIVVSDGRETTQPWLRNVWDEVIMDSNLHKNLQSVKTICRSCGTQCGKSIVQVLVISVDIGVVTYEVMTSQSRRSVVQLMVVRVDIGVVIYEAMAPQCGRSVVQVLVVRVDIGVVTMELWHPSVGDQWFRSWLSEWI